MGGGGSSGIGDILKKYVVPGVETAAGAVSEFFAPGNPVGLSAMGSGIGQLSGGAAGGSGGQAIGGDIGGMAGTFGGGSGLGGGVGSSVLPITDTSTQLNNLAAAGFPGAQQMTGLTPFNDAVAGAAAPAGPAPTSIMSQLGPLLQSAGPGVSAFFNRPKPTAPTPSGGFQMPAANPAPIAPVTPAANISPMAALQRYRDFLRSSTV